MCPQRQQKKLWPAIASPAQALPKGGRDLDRGPSPVAYSWSPFHTGKGRARNLGYYGDCAIACCSPVTYGLIITSGCGWRTLTAVLSTSVFAGTCWELGTYGLMIVSGSGQMFTSGVITSGRY